MAIPKAVSFMFGILPVYQQCNSSLSMYSMKDI